MANIPNALNIKTSKDTSVPRPPAPSEDATLSRLALKAGLVPLVAASSIVGLSTTVFTSCNHTPVRSPMDAYEGFADTHPSLLVTNPRVLLSLETDRFSFGDVLGVRSSDATRPMDYSDESADILGRSPIYADLVASLREDLAALEGVTPQAGIGPSYKHRLFDMRWLASDRTHFELVGVVNRLDFRSLVPPGCGETRLIYRLAYRPASRPQTRLPLTINVVYENREARCDEVARRWLAVEHSPDVVAELLRGPLAKLHTASFDRIEVDMQSMRENSTNSTMDDHAEYILRSFRVESGHLVGDALRNTPDTNLAPDKKEALRHWIGENLDAIDRGTAEIRFEYLAKVATSVTPRGLDRMGNRPFKTLFPSEDASFRDLPLGDEKLVKTPLMLVRRLDEMTCVGCHQSRTIAGFHLLGEDRTSDTFNTMVLGTSEHLREILEFRFRFLTAAAAGRVSTEPVPIAEHVNDQGEYGAHCAVQDGTSNELPDWPCALGFVCDKSSVDHNPIGQCLRDGSSQIGDPCQGVELIVRPGPDGDAITPHASNRCAPIATLGGAAEHSSCEPNTRGFVGGMCTAPCSKVGDVVHGDVCVRVPHHGFERECFAPDAVLERCLEEPMNKTLSLLRKCSRVEPCRDDMVCGRVTNDPPGEGACMPTYFLFQSRVDGPPLDR